MNSPLSVLYTEHEYITNVVQRIDKLRELIDTDTEDYATRSKSFIDFFRNYGDSYHHQKEEQLSCFRQWVTLRNRRLFSSVVIDADPSATLSGERVSTRVE